MNKDLFFLKNCFEGRCQYLESENNIDKSIFIYYCTKYSKTVLRIVSSGFPSIHINNQYPCQLIEEWK